MVQQSSRYLFKQSEKIAKGKKCEGYFSYMNDTETLCKSKSTAKTIDEFLEWDHLTAALSTRSAFFTRHVAGLFNNDSSGKKVKENELYAIEVQKMTRYHLNYVLYEMAKKRVTNYSFKD